MSGGTSQREARFLHEIYRELAERHAGREALLLRRAPHDGVTLRWGDLEARRRALARDLAARGIDASGRCAVELVDHPDLLPLLLAIWSAGGVVVPLDDQWGDAFVRTVLDVSTPAALFSASPEHGFEASRLAPRAAPQPLPEHTAIVSFTSGSTADPKGVVLGHRQLLAAYRSGARHLAALASTRPTRFGCAMRLSGLGVLGMSYLFAAVQGASVVVLPILELRTARGFWSGVEENGVDFLYLVPPLVELLNRLADPPASPPKLTCLAGAAPLSTAAQERFQDRFGVGLLNAYGLTEVAFAAFFGDVDRAGRGTPWIGRPMTVAARLRGEDGAIVSGPGTGELELGGETLADGYLGNPIATQQTFRDGWCITGDLAERDASERYRITGRVKDVVLKGGFVVHLAEVEEAAGRLSGVAEAGAVRLDLPGGMEDIGLVVRLDAGTPPDACGMRAQLETRLGRQRAPRRIVFSDRPLPRGGQQKLQRRRLEELWSELATGE